MSLLTRTNARSTFSNPLKAMSIPIPENEPQRIRALLNYHIMDSEPEDLYDGLTKLAASICGTPTALVSLVDQNRQWFKSRVGLDVSETPRDISFCTHTIFNPHGPLVIEDALLDPRFLNNPLVTEAPYIRFYAGMPLISPDGYALGSLCVIDYVPRRLSDEQLSNLKLLAEQVVSQMELRRSLKKNADLAEYCHRIMMQASDGIHLFDFKGRVISVNEKFCELTGKTAAELVGKNVDELIHNEDTIFQPTDFEQFRDGQTQITEKLLIRPGGKRIIVEISAKKLDEQTIQGIVRDITKRKKIELALSESERRFRDFINQSLALFCTHDLDGNILSVNPAATESLGYLENELVGKNLRDILTPKSREVLPIYLAKIQQQGKSDGFMQVLNKRGEKRIWSYRNIVRTDAQDRPYILGSAQDVTEYRRNEEELIKGRKIFESFMQNNPAIIFLKDEKGRFIFVNKTHERLFGKTSSELAGQTVFDVLPEGAAIEAVTNDREAYKSGKVVESVLKAINPDGEEIFLLNYKFPIETQSGEKLLGGVAIDITEQKRMENELRTARDSALESARLKSAFLTNVSHEIRTPMNGVIGMTELLLQTSLDQTQQDYAQAIRQSGENLLTVINDILDLSKIEAGRLSLESVEFNVRRLIELTVQGFSDRAYQKNLQINSSVESDVPDQVCGDRGKLRQVLANLISNAIKFTEQGEVGIAVRIDKDFDGNIVLGFEVSDTGIGIDEKALKNLFQPFVQADNSTTREFGGTGLGLAISKKLVETMNGEIRVDSISGKGSKFYFSATFTDPKDLKTETCSPEANQESSAIEKIEVAPMIEPPAPGETSVIVVNPLPAKNPQNDVTLNIENPDSLSILVVDDNEINRRLVTKQLSQIGLTADIAVDGVDALEKYTAKNYQLILMDCQMPRLDGYDTAREIRRRERENILYGKSILPTRIVALTAHTLAGEKEKCLAAGMDDYLPKPIKIKDLSKILELWVL